MSRAGSMASVTDQDGTLSASLHLKVILGIKIDKGSQATETKTKRDEWLASGRDVLGGLRLPQQVHGQTYIHPKAFWT